jgi:hypothetical protein
MIQATTILFSIALKKSFVPDHPNDRPGEVRVVDTRMPSQGETKSGRRASGSAPKPCIGVRVILDPIVFTMRQPPASVPSVIAI